MSDDLRSALESAVEEHSAPEPSAPVESATPVETSNDAGGSASEVVDAPAETKAERGSPDSPKSIEEVAASDTPVEEKDDKPKPIDKIDTAPQSWKGESKKVWADLPAHVRQEVIRREREITKGLNETAQVRQQITQVQEVIAPHMDRINAIYGGNTIQAINNLMGVERTLVSGDPIAKAQLVANMVKHFNIDLRTLDSLLVGQEAPQEVQQQSNLEKLLEQKLAPFNQFLTAQQQRELQQQQRAEQELTQTVESMASDPQFPYFNEVREDMADLIDLAAKKGLYLSLPEAYSKAVRMNDSTFQASATRNSSQAATQAALQAHQAAQKAKEAAVSVSGSPSGVGGNVGNPSDLRGTILSAFGETGRL
jgi:hypothetical protein